MKKIIVIILIGFFMTGQVYALLTDDLLAYWDFEDSENNVLIDVHSYKWNGSLEGATNISTAGIIGTGWNFDGINDIVRINNTSAAGIELDLMVQARTFQVWFKPTDTDGTLIAKRDGGCCGQWQLYYQVSGSEYAIRYHYEDTLGGEEFWEATTTFPVGAWKHIIVRTDSNGIPDSFYVNGTNQSLSHTGQNDLVVHENTDVSIGARWGGDPTTAFQANAIIDEVGIWNRSLTPSEISELWNNGAGLSYDNFAPSDTCTAPGSGDWTVTDNCIWDSPQNVPANLIISGSSIPVLSSTLTFTGSNQLIIFESSGDGLIINSGGIQ